MDENINEEFEQETVEKYQHTLGQYLSECRSKKNVDLKNIAVTTRINFNILHDIENDIDDNLPNRTYLRGFVKSFAKSVDADENYALELLDHKLNVQIEPVEQQTRGAQRAIEMNEILNKDFKQLEDLKNTVSRIEPATLLKVVSILLVFSVGGTFVYKLFNNTKKEAQLAKKQLDAPKQTPSAIVEEPKVVETKEEPKVIETKEEPKVVKTKEEPKVVETKEDSKVKEGPKKEELTEPTKLPEVRSAGVYKQLIEKGYRFRPIATPVYNLEDNEKVNDESLLPEKVKSAIVSGKQNVFINAVYDDTWINYKNTNGKIKGFVLKKGKTLFLRGEEILLFVGRLKAVEIFLNNKYVATSSPSGVKSLVFPNEKAKNYNTPLFIFDKEKQQYFTEAELIQELGLN